MVRSLFADDLMSHAAGYGVRRRVTSNQAKYDSRCIMVNRADTRHDLRYPIAVRGVSRSGAIGAAGRGLVPLGLMAALGPR